MLTEEQLTLAIQRHVNDNINLGAVPVKIILDSDFKEYVSWSSYQWEDGVPVTKYFSRNEEIPLFIPKGTTIRGMAFRGKKTGSIIFDFYYGGTWYEIGCADLVFQNFPYESL